MFLERKNNLFLDTEKRLKKTEELTVLFDLASDESIYCNIRVVADAEFMTE